MKTIDLLQILNSKKVQYATLKLKCKTKVCLCFFFEYRSFTLFQIAPKISNFAFMPPDLSAQSGFPQVGATVKHKELNLVLKRTGRG